MDQGGPPQPPGQQPQQSAVPPPIQPAPMAMKWSYFKQVFSGKPEENPEAHIPSTIDWMDTHNFVEGQTIQRLSLMPAGEMTLWYQSIHPFQGTWEEWQERFRTQYSSIGDKHEQLFHVWRSFNLGENAEIIDAYVQRIRQIAVILNYGKSHILEEFKNTLPSHLYWLLFPIDNLRQAVEIAKRILNKGKLDRELAGQSTGASLFLTMKGDAQCKTVLFNENNMLDTKIALL